MQLRKNRSSQLPEINLVPMLDVLMTVLTFFIIVSMTLTLEKKVDIELPSNAPSAPQPAQPAPMIVSLDSQGQLLIDGTPSEATQLPDQIESYLAQSEEGIVVLQADPLLPYEQVVQTLADMKEIGGGRVSLAIE